MIKLYKLVFSSEFFFAAFLLAGYFKGGIPWFPIDITIFCLLVTLGMSLFKLLNNFTLSRASLISIVMFVIFTGFVWLSYYRTSSVIYADDKLVRFLIITTWSYLGVFVIIKSKESMIKFFKSIIVISSVVSVIALYELFIRINSGTYAGSIFIMDTDYLALGRTVGLGLVLFIGLYWFGNQGRNLLNILLPVMMGIVIVFSGGRMPLISLIISLAVMVILSVKPKRGSILSVNKGVFRMVGLFLVSVLFFIPFYINGTFDDIFWRIESMLAGGDASTFVRLTLFDTAKRMFETRPLLGTGWGSFPLYYYGVDQKVYPHNIFLEIVSEMGMFALISFLLLLAYALYRGVIVYKRKYGKFNNVQMAIIGGFIFFLLNANASGDITDNKILFTFISLLVVSTVYNPYEEVVKIPSEKRMRKKRLVWRKSARLI